MSVNAADTSIEKKDHHGLLAIEHLRHRLEQSTSGPERQQIQEQIAEIQFAIDNNHRPSIPPYVDIIEFPILMADALHNPVARGKRPATNNTISSAVWQRPAAIDSADLFVGFDRSELPKYDRIWTYSGSKRAGRNPGCLLISGDQRIKVKFAETHSEPFTSRIFHAVGYNVDPTDYAPALKIKYDRRFFDEFNQRRPMKLQTGMFFIPIVHFNLQTPYDPFAFIESAVLKDGHAISAAELKSLFAQKNDAEVHYLITKPANVQIETPHTQNIGPWAFGGRGHEDVRELRGAGLLAAWLGWWDSRFENTRLRVVKGPDGPTLKYFWTDLGGGLGRAGGTFSHTCESPDDFGWTFTKSIRYGHTASFRIIDYQPVEDTPAFAEMTVEDARWMARLIAKLTEQQIVDALSASGFSSSEVHIYTEKLLSRRDNLLIDLQLTNEFTLLRRDTGGAPTLMSKSR
jgi:hypothetical protein